MRMRARMGWRVGGIGLVQGRGGDWEDIVDEGEDGEDGGEVVKLLDTDDKDMVEPVKESMFCQLNRLFPIVCK